MTIHFFMCLHFLFSIDLFISSFGMEVTLFLLCGYALTFFLAHVLLFCTSTFLSHSLVIQLVASVQGLFCGKEDSGVPVNCSICDAVAALSY